MSTPEEIAKAVEHLKVYENSMLLTYEFKNALSVVRTALAESQAREAPSTTTVLGFTSGGPLSREYFKAALEKCREELAESQAAAAKWEADANHQCRERATEIEKRIRMEATLAESQAKLAEAKKDYYDVANSICRESKDTADLCRQARELRQQLEAAKKDSERFLYVVEKIDFERLLALPDYIAEAREFIDTLQSARSEEGK